MNRITRRRRVGFGFTAVVSVKRILPDPGFSHFDGPAATTSTDSLDALYRPRFPGGRERHKRLYMDRDGLPY